jgi:predicted NBD/HSP70 family sugar kinase
MVSATPDEQSRDRRPAIVRVFDAACDAGPIARSTLRRMVGTSPSTISAAVQDLLEAGLVKEHGRGASTGGRQPTLLDLDPRSGGVLAVDVGGHALRAASANLRGDIQARAERRTPLSPQPAKLRSAIDALLDEVAGALSGPVRAIAVSVAGVVRPQTRTVTLAVNLPGWRDVDPAEWLTRFGAIVLVENEANMAVIGEQARGSARGCDDVVFLAMGAGIGAGLLVGGKLFRGKRGAAGEVGMMLTGVGGTDLEQAVNAGHLVERFEQAGGATGRTAAEIFAAAASGAEPAMQVVGEVLDSLGVCLTNTISLLDPDTIVLGGGYAGAGTWLINELGKRVSAMLPSTPPLVLATLGTEAALVGAVFTAVTAARSELAVMLEGASALV